MVDVSRRRFLTLGGGAAAGAVLGGSFLSACSSGGGSSSSDGPSELVYTFLATKDLPDLGTVNDQVNALLSDRGAPFTVTLNPLQDYGEVMTLRVASGDPGDLYFTAPWANPYSANASDGNLLALDDLLPEHAPGLYGSMSPETWDAARVNGSIYGVINQQRFPKMWGYQGRQEVVDQLGMDPASITSFAELEPFLARVKETTDLLPWGTSNQANGKLFQPEIHGYDPIVVTLAVAVRYDDTSLEAFCWYDTPEFEEAVRLARSWNEQGIMEATPPSNEDMNSRWNAGQTAFMDAQYLPTNPQNNSFPTIGNTFMTTPLLNTDGVLATLTGINADVENPEHVLGLLEYLHTDEEIYRTICFGIEGTHYVVSADNPDVVEAGPEQAAWDPNTDWVFGNQFNAPYRNQADAEAGRWDRERELNESATPSAAIGFSLVTDELRTEVASVTAAIAEHATLAQTGQLDAAEALSNLRSAVEQAGMPKILEVTQRQLDEFRGA